MRTSAGARAILPYAAILILLGSATKARAIGPEFQINTLTTGYQFRPSVVPDGTGGFLVVWSTAGAPDSIQGQRFAGDGTPLGTEFQVNTVEPGEEGNQSPAIGPDGAGGLVVVWGRRLCCADPEGYSIQGQRLTSSGTPVGGQFQVNAYTTGHQRRPVVEVDGAGGFVVAWDSEGSSGSDTSLTSVQARRFTSAGAPLGPEFQVNTYTVARQYPAAIGPDPAGGFVVAWGSDGSDGTDTDGVSVQAQRFSSTGAPLGSEFQVNTYTTSYQFDPAVGADGAGGFVVVWHGLGLAGSGIHGQRYSSSGTPAGGEFQVSNALGRGGIPAVGSDGAGGFVVAWMSDEQISGSDTSGARVHARRYTSDGVPTSGQFQVNTYTTDDQAAPAVGPDGAGGFVVTWSSAGSGGTDTSATSIQGQRFASTTLETGVVARKLVVLDRLAFAGNAKVVYVAKDAAVTKNNGQDPDGIGVEFRISYDGEDGRFDVPTGAFGGDTGWKVNKEAVAKFVNRAAPAGPTLARTVLVKPGKLIKLVAKGLGDGDPLDIVTQGSPSGSVFTSLCVANGGETTCHCTEFQSCVYTPLAAGSGAKLVCKSPNGPDAGCAALASPSGAFLD